MPDHKLDQKFISKEVATELLLHLVATDNVAHPVRVLKSIDQENFIPYLNLVIAIPYEEVAKIFPEGYPECQNGG